MIYSRSQSTSKLISFVISLLVVATQALPIDNPAGSLNIVAPIDTPNPISLLIGEGHPSLFKRAVGGFYMSGASFGPDLPLGFVRRAVGTVADPQPLSAIYATSRLEKRSGAPDTPIASLDLPPPDGPAPPGTNLIHFLEKRSLRFHRPASLVKSKSPPSRLSHEPEAEQKWRQRAWK